MTARLLPADPDESRRALRDGFILLALVLFSPALPKFRPGAGPGETHLPQPAGP